MAANFTQFIDCYSRDTIRLGLIIYDCHHLLDADKNDSMAAVSSKHLSQMPAKRSQQLSPIQEASIPSEAAGGARVAALAHLTRQPAAVHMLFVPP